MWTWAKSWSGPPRRPEEYGRRWDSRTCTPEAVLRPTLNDYCSHEPKHRFGV